MIYLEQHPPARRQFYKTRARDITGLIAMHTAENLVDLTPPDNGAENVARFIATRTDAAGSYHSVSDTDSIVQLGRFEWTMFGARRYNAHVLHHGISGMAAGWGKLRADYRGGLIDKAGEATARMAVWVRTTTGIEIPARRLTKADADAGFAGFIDHSRLDPSRRHDPGDGFPWFDFLEAYERHLQGDDLVAQLQAAINELGYKPPLATDGVYGPLTDTAARIVIAQLQGFRELVSATINAAVPLIAAAQRLTAGNT